MQFHLNGFEPGDPEIVDPSDRYPTSGAQGSVPEAVDVLGIGRIGPILGPVIGGILIGMKLPMGALFLCAAVPGACCAVTLVALRSATSEQWTGRERTRPAVSIR